MKKNSLYILLTILCLLLLGILSFPTIKAYFSVPAQTQISVDSIDTKNVELIMPLLEQVTIFRDREIRLLEGSSWQKYQQVISSYPIELAHGRPGFGFDPTFDYLSNIPDGWEVVYDNTTNVEGMNGFQIIAPLSMKSEKKSFFYVRQWVGGMGLTIEDNGVTHLSGAYGLFYDDVKRLVKEAKSA